MASNNNYAFCKRCEDYFVFMENEVYWDEKGFGYSTKLCTCPKCKRPVVIKYNEDGWLDVNNDKRFYGYGSQR